MNKKQEIKLSIEFIYTLWFELRIGKIVFHCLIRKGLEVSHNLLVKISRLKYF